MTLNRFGGFIRDALPKQAIVEQSDPLAASKLAFWMQTADPNTLVRYNRKTPEAHEDGDTSWAMVTETIFQKVSDTRTAFQRVAPSWLGGQEPEEPDMRMPNGEGVKRISTKEGYLVMTLPDTENIAVAVESRTSDAVVTILAERLAMVKEAMLIRRFPFAMDYEIASLPDALLPMNKAKELYKKALETLLSKNAVLNDEHMTEEERVLVGQLEKFLKTCVWASMHGDAIHSEESYRGTEPLGGALIMRERETHGQHTHSATRATNALPYLSIVNDDVSFRWAALGFSKQAAVLMNFAKLKGKKETRGDFLDIERDSAQIEIALANVFSQGMLRKSLNAVAKGLGGSHQDAMQYVLAVDDLFKKDFDRITASLDLCVEPAKPKSKAEMNLRHGFHRGAILFAIAEKVFPHDVPNQNKLKNQMVECLYHAMGAKIGGKEEA